MIKEIFTLKRSTSVIVVRYFQPTPVGVHICFRQHTCFDPSARPTFTAMLNHLAYCLSNTMSFPKKAIVVSTYWAFVTPFHRFWALFFTFSVSPAISPATFVYLSRASSNNNALSRCSSTSVIGTVDVSPNLDKAQILPLVNHHGTCHSTCLWWHAIHFLSHSCEYSSY